MRSHTQKNTARAGFSLIEMLIVIGIIGILVAVLFGALGGSLESARIASTRVTLQQIDDVLQQRYEAILQADVRSDAATLSSLNSGVSKEQAEFIIRKILYRQALPQQNKDLFGLNLQEFTGTAPPPDDDAPFAAAYETAGGDFSATQTDITAAELFFFAMTKGTTVRAFPGGKIHRVPTLDPGNINIQHIAVNSTTKLSSFVDDWGKPLRFYNFPTQLFFDNNSEVMVSGIPTGALNQDPLDALGFLSDPFIHGRPSTTPPLPPFFYAPGASLNQLAFNPANYHDRGRHYVPLLVSLGPDGALGLGEPFSGTATERLCSVNASPDEMFDNITNRQR